MPAASTPARQHVGLPHFTFLYFPLLCAFRRSPVEFAHGQTRCALCATYATYATYPNVRNMLECACAVTNLVRPPPSSHVRVWARTHTNASERARTRVRKRTHTLTNAERQTLPRTTASSRTSWHNRASPTCTVSPSSPLSHASLSPPPSPHPPACASPLLSRRRFATG